MQFEAFHLASCKILTLSQLCGTIGISRFKLLNFDHEFGDRSFKVFDTIYIFGNNVKITTINNLKYS